MKLENIQPLLVAILGSTSTLAPNSENIFADDGNQKVAMENALKNKGIAVLVMLPQGAMVYDETRKSAVIAYVSTIWVRTNPSYKPKWDVMKIEAEILSGVISNDFAPGSHPFTIPSGMEPETDFTDLGNNSRLIRFLTKVVFR